LKDKKRLHKNILFLEYNNKSDEKGSMHTHLPETGDFITSTDICTLMLYEKFTQWEQYLVISAKYVSFWNCKSNILTVISLKAFDRIGSALDKK
jgi:hypothetical protein